jgi:hypothetical protein
MIPFARAAAVLGIGALCAASPALAQPADQSVFVMGGPFTTGHFEDTFLFWQDHYESNFFAGLGYQHFLYAYQGGFQLGVEAGFGLRLGESASIELWAGPVARLTTFTIGDISITPAVTAGISVVSNTIGTEAQRAAEIGDPARVLYYLGPEISVSHAAYPEFEGFFRVQHRSGGWGTIAEIDGSNAAVLGLRYKF